MAVEDDSKGSSRLTLWLIIGAFAVFVIWLGGTALITNQLAGDSSAAELGAVGDRFGAVNALFSGLAFLGLMIVWLYEMQERRRDLRDRNRARRPFIAPSLFQSDDLIHGAQLGASPDYGLKLTDASKLKGAGHATLKFELGLSNMTDEIALGVVGKICLSLGGGVQAEGALTMPLGSRSSSVVVIETTLSGDAVIAFFNELSAGFDAEVIVEYGSLNGARWSSKVAIKARPDDNSVNFSQDDLIQIANGKMGVGRSDDDVRVVEYRCEPKPESWAQDILESK